MLKMKLLGKRKRKSRGFISVLNENMQRVGVTEQDARDRDMLLQPLKGERESEGVL